MSPINSSQTYSLAQLGWRPFHSQQLTLQDLETAYPARVSSVHRSGLIVLSELGTATVSVPPRITEQAQLPITVGDWVLIDVFIDQASTLSAGIAIVAVNGTQPDSIAGLRPWLQRGQAIAFVGSSGVGKSTLVNTLTGNTSQSTSGIREDDSRGRHTTTAREMFALAGDAWVIDTPGMRELKIGAIDNGLRTVFDNIEVLAAQCHFRDCRHETEVGCAVLAAIAEGRLDARRFANYRKLQRETAHAAMTPYERRERDRQFGRMQSTALRALYRSRRK